MSTEIFKSVLVLLFIYCGSAFAMENQKFETDVLPKICVLPLILSQRAISENRYAFIKYLQEQKSDTNAIPAAFLLGLPGDALCDILFWFCKNKKLANDMVSYAKKESLGKSLCLYALVIQAKGAPFMKMDESMKLAYTSPETYFLCKRLFHEFKKEIIEESNESDDHIIEHFLVLAPSERRSLTNGALFLEYNTDVDNDEITLLKKYLPESIKQEVGKYYVKPRKKLIQSLATTLWVIPLASSACLGVYMCLPFEMAWHYLKKREWIEGEYPTFSYSIKDCKQFINVAWYKMAYKDLVCLELLLD